MLAACSLLLQAPIVDDLQIAPGPMQPHESKGKVHPPALGI